MNEIKNVESTWVDTFAKGVGILCMVMVVGILGMGIYIVGYLIVTPATDQSHLPYCEQSYSYHDVRCQGWFVAHPPDAGVVR
jgi:hypothetical protein